MLSYNEIIKINKAFADAHYVIKNFGNGERWQIVDHDQQASFKYPLMFMEDLTNSSSNKEYIYGFKIWFVTRVESPSDRGTDLLFSEFAKAKSDMIQCAQDLIAYWVQDTNYPSLEIDRSFSIETFIEDTKDKLTGCSMDIRFKEVINYDNCLIPMDGVPAPASSDVTVTINDTSFANLLAGTTNNITVIDTNGTEVGSKTGNLEWTVPAAGGGNAGNSLNGTSLTDIATGTTKTFTITYADLSPVVVTTTSDNATAFVGTVPNPAGTIAPFRPVLTQAASVATYDEKWHIDNGTFDYPYTTNSLIQQLDPTDPQKVLFDDSAVTGISAHKYRWINPTTGGYFNSDDGTYRDSNGNVSTYAAVFKPGTYYLGVDRWTWILWNLKRGSSFTWADALNEPPSATLDGITGFFLPPQPYFDTLDRNDKILPTYLNDNPPMDIQLNKWSCTAYAASPTTQAWEVLNNGSETAASNVLSFVASYMKPYTW